MNILSYICLGYLILCSIRILLSWFHSPDLESVKIFFNRLTDPYLNLFRGMTWARIGMFDFSIIIGIMILGFAQWFFASLGSGVFPTLGAILAYILLRIWSFFSFLLIALSIVLIIRLFFILLRRESPIWYSIDGMLTNLTSRVLGVFTRKPVSYSVALGITAGILIAIRFAVYYLVVFLAALMASSF